MAEVAEEAGITFCFAVKFHPALRHVAAARRELGIRTTFNFLGPLTNPAQVRAQATGVADPRMAPDHGGRARRARLVRAGLPRRRRPGRTDHDGDLARLVWCATARSREQAFDPRDVGIDLVAVEALRGGDASYNADVARRLLAGETGPVRDAVLLNSAAALVALDPGTGTAGGAARGRHRPAAESIDSGAARAAPGAVGGGQQRLVRGSAPSIVAKAPVRHADRGLAVARSCGRMLTRS